MEVIFRGALKTHRILSRVGRGIVIGSVEIGKSASGAGRDPRVVSSLHARVNKDESDEVGEGEVEGGKERIF